LSLFENRQTFRCSSRLTCLQPHWITLHIFSKPLSLQGCDVGTPRYHAMLLPLSPHISQLLLLTVACCLLLSVYAALQKWPLQEPRLPDSHTQAVPPQLCQLTNSRTAGTLCKARPLKSHSSDYSLPTEGIRIVEDTSRRKKQSLTARRGSGTPIA
jgi:hypothetical protein